jgi:hypothetical protein
MQTNNYWIAASDQLLYFFFLFSFLTTKVSVLKPGPAREVDPGLVRVEAKTRSGIDPGKPGRPGGLTRDQVHLVKPG